MVSKRPASNGPPKAIPKPRHSSHLSAKLSTATANKSLTILLSSFSPPDLRLSLYASVVQGLDAQRLRVHDVSTGRLRCEYLLEKGLTCNSITWGHLPINGDGSKKKKKRKRVSDANGVPVDDSTEPAVTIALSINKSKILLYSPTEGAIVGELEGGHTGEVWQFKFVNEDNAVKGWSCGADGKLVKWDLRTKSIVSVIALPEQSIRTLAIFSPTSILCASHTIYVIDPFIPNIPQTKFAASISQIHTLLASASTQSFLVASETDRYVNIFSLAQGKQTDALVADSDVTAVSIARRPSSDSTPDGEVTAAAVVTSDGIVELFPRPFTSTVPTDTQLNRKKQAITTRKADSRIRIIRPVPSTKHNRNPTPKALSIVDAFFQTPEELIVAWVENGVNVEFEKIRWHERVEASENGVIDIVKARPTNVTNVDFVNGAKDMGRTHVDQSNTIFVSGTDVNMIDANDEEDERDDDGKSDTSGDEDEETAANIKGEPSFYDRFQALEVTASATNNPNKALAKQTSTSAKALKPFQGTLTTVLTQALKTNDSALLESCLQATDSKVILSTVRRLDSVYAPSLIERLSERINKRPGRATSLGLWVRWTLVAHGGYLVSLPNLMKTLAGLHATLATRAGALPKLLQLQGRLDMLNAQLELRNELRRGKGAGETGLDLEEEEIQKEEGVLYVEGKSVDYISDSEEEEEARRPRDEVEDQSDVELEEVGMEGLQIEDASFIKGRMDGDEDEDAQEDFEDGIEDGEDDENIVDIAGSSDEEEDDLDDDDGKLRYGGLAEEMAEETDDDDDDDDEDEEDEEDEDEDMVSDGDDISDDEGVIRNNKSIPKGIKAGR